MRSDRPIELLYKFRWPLSGLVLLVMFGSLGLGWQRVEKFTKQVDALADKAPDKAEPRFLDLRTDIWFDTKDPALAAYRELETKYIGEDAIIIAFEDKNDPFGVFGVKSLETVAELTKKLEKVRYVRAVRSLTAFPWIRWGMVGNDPDNQEPGLIVKSLFENAPNTYSETDRLRRMIAVIGATNASKLVGEQKVRALLGPKADFADYIGEPRLLKAIVSESGRATTLLVQVLRPRISDERLTEVFGSSRELQKTGLEIHVSVAQAEALAGIKKVLAETETDYKFRLAGGPVMQHHFQETAAKDMRFMGAMFLAIALLLLVIYRRAAGVLLPLMVVLLAIFGMMGIILVKGDLINNMTASSPIILIAIGVADAVHLVTAYYLLRPRHADRKSLIMAVVKHNAMPVFLTSVTTAIGFLSLMTSGIMPTRMFGYTIALGTMLAYVLSMTLVPAILSLFKVRAKTGHEPPEPEPENTWSDRLTTFVIGKRAPIVAVGVLLTVLAGIGFTKIDIQADMRLMFGKDDPQVVDLMWLNDNIGGTGDLEILFDSPDTQIAQSSAFLAKLDKFQARLERESLDQESPLRILANFDSPLGVLRKIHQVRNENKAAFYRVPTLDDVPVEARKPRVLIDEVTEEKIVIPAQSADTMIAQYYLQFESGASPTDNLSTLMTPDRKSIRVTIRTRMAPTGTTLAAYARVREIAKTEFPELAKQMRLTGNYFMQMNMTDTFAQTMVQSLSIALIVITLLIMLVFRSPLIGLLSIVPNILPIMIPFGLFALFGVALDGPAVMVATVGLGICVDDTIHFLTKYTRARNRGLKADDAVRESFRAVGAALTYTTIVLVGGFAMMGFASFRPNAMVGYLGATMIALAWVADFILTPAVISYLPDKKAKARTDG